MKYTIIFKCKIKLYDQQIKAQFPVGNNFFFVFQYVRVSAWTHSVSNGASAVGYSGHGVKVTTHLHLLMSQDCWQLYLCFCIHMFGVHSDNFMFGVHSDSFMFGVHSDNFIKLKGKNFTYQLHIRVGFMHLPDDTSRAMCQNTVLSNHTKTRDSAHCTFQCTNTTSPLNLFDCSI